MARIRYVPYDQDREDQKAEEKAERRASRNDSDGWVPPDPSFGRLDPNDPEFESVDEFAQWLYDDDREEFTHQELACLNARLGLRTQVIRAELEGYGLMLKRRSIKREVRGFTANPNTRWAGNPMAGGGGGGSICGMAD